MVKLINQVVVFCLELVMLIAYGRYGMAQPWGLVPRLLFTALIVSAAVVLWSLLAAPRSAHRLEAPFLMIFRALMFMLAALVLFRSGYKQMAVVSALLAVVTQTVSYFTEK